MTVDGLVLADAVFRFGAVSLLALSALVVLRQSSGTWAGRLVPVALLGAAVYLVCSVVPAGGPAWLPVTLVCVANPALVWLGGRALFDDGFEPSPFHWAVPGLLLALYAARSVAALNGRDDLFEGLLSAHYAISAVLALHLLWTVGRDARQDLVEARRRLRRIVIAIGALLLLAIVGVELVIQGSAVGDRLLLLQSAVFWGLSAGVAFALWVWRDQAADVLASARLQPPADGRPLPRSPEARRVLALMEDDRAFLEPGLSVGALAARAGLAEHRCRHVINRELGFRNFSDFLNGYRIEEAARRIADPDQRRLPVLTIALDVGFGSIGPFNRAFKARFGVTPSAYRRTVLDS